MMYNVITTPEADEEFARLAKDEPKVFLKAQRFIEELKEHPKTGLGHPEPLKGKPELKEDGVERLQRNTDLSIVYMKPKWLSLY